MATQIERIPIELTPGQLVAQRSLQSLKWLGGAARKKPLGAIAALWLLMLIVGAVFAPLVTIHDPLRIYNNAFHLPAWTRTEDGGLFILGGDTIGRDLFSRVIYGARTSLAVGFGAVALGITGGSVVGLLSGYLGGKVDMVLQRFVDSLMAIPPLIKALVVVALLGASLFNIMLSISILMVPHTARLVRGLVLATKENVYIEAARAVGASSMRVAFLHVLPNVTHGIIIVAATWLGAAVIVEATLSFLGMGLPPPHPTWGQMLSQEGRANMIQNPMLLAVPAITIASTVLAFNFLGDALRDLLDPRLKQ